MTEQEKKRTFPLALMESNVWSLGVAIQRSHGMVGQHLSELTVSELFVMLAVNHIELKCTYLGDLSD